MSSQQEPHRRFNPWASPDFVPPGMRPNQELSEAKNRQKEEQENKNKQKSLNSPWSDPNFKPKEPEQQDPSKSLNDSSNLASDDELAEALAMSLETDSPSTDADDKSATTIPSESSSANDVVADDSSSPKVNDPSLVASINQDFLKELLNMGFPRIRAEKSLILTKNSNLEAATNWLLSNKSTADIDEPLKVIGSQETNSKKKKVWGDNERGAPLGYKPGDEYDNSDDDLDDSAKSILKGISKKKYTFKPQKEDQSKPLTKEEKLTQLEEKRQQRRIDMAKSEIDQQKERDRTRMRTTQDAAELKRKRAEIDHRLLIENKNREKTREKERKRRIKEKIKEDKLRRKVKAEMRRNEAEARKAKAASDI